MSALWLQSFIRKHEKTTNRTKILSSKWLNIDYAFIIKTHFEQLYNQITASPPIMHKPNYKTTINSFSQNIEHLTCKIKNSNENDYRLNLTDFAMIRWQSYVKMLSIQHEKQNLLLKKFQWEKRKLWKIVFLGMKELKWIEKRLPESWEIEEFGARLRCGEEREREKGVAETKKKVQYECKNAFFISERWRKTD